MALSCHWKVPERCDSTSKLNTLRQVPLPPSGSLYTATERLDVRQPTTSARKNGLSVQRHGRETWSKGWSALCESCITTLLFRGRCVHHGDILSAPVNVCLACGPLLQDDLSPLRRMRALSQLRTQSIGNRSPLRQADLAGTRRNSGLCGEPPPSPRDVRRRDKMECPGPAASETEPNVAFVRLFPDNGPSLATDRRKQSSADSFEIE
ncbi:hypothetical protein AVEN_156448-1 [Araneus ventricosus]|uniref:Uncharacterized protein n=1 Tax=Araneus ventricosus TaxID=182803 RepID=A0A4Y2JYD4_ARAVE|nr:hypothetical protein AVEN_156448-1 [Araneus ventricosus]